MSTRSFARLVSPLRSRSKSKYLRPTDSHPLAAARSTGRFGCTHPVLAPRLYSTAKEKPGDDQILGTKKKTEDPTPSNDAVPQIYTFEEVQDLSNAPPPKPSVLIDVREPHELISTGTIPGAINLPVTSAPEAVFLPPAEFRLRMGYNKPAPGQRVVFFCKAGVRSRAAAAFARQAGWKDVVEYPGSWNDWTAKGGTAERWQPGIGR